MTFKYPKQVSSDHSIQKTIEKIIEGQHLILEGDGTFYMFPYNNIKYIRITPSDGSSLPLATIKGVSLVS